MDIKIRYEDIFDYVVGNTTYDPIERQVDPERYEVYDHAIYDHYLKESVPQSEAYYNYTYHLRKLKEKVGNMSSSEVQRICKEIQEIAPKQLSILKPVVDRQLPLARLHQQNFEELSDEVICWATERGIFEKGDPLAQLNKTQEELNETIQAVKDQDGMEIADGIGDMLVTIIIAAKMMGYDATQCLQQAYDEIKDRTGKMVGGQFVKDKWS